MQKPSYGGNATRQLKEEIKQINNKEPVTFKDASLFLAVALDSSLSQKTKEKFFFRFKNIEIKKSLFQSLTDFLRRYII